MKKRILLVLIVLGIISTAVFAGCGNVDDDGITDNITTAPSYVFNGGFESANLNGWTVEYGDAFSDDCVVSKKTFSYSYDSNGTEINVNQTGNWYLSGKAFDESYSNARTGAIRSQNFILGSDGMISMKLAGGALSVAKGENAAEKAQEKVCYVGVYLSEDDSLIGYQTNEYFLEHTESYVNASMYNSGSYITDNFYAYTLYLSEYAGKEMYIRIVDADDGYYYSYFCVDDIRVNGYDVQTEGAYFVKSRSYATEAVRENEYQIINGGFESGSLAGWTVTSGTAFSNEGINSNSVWWNENITYNRDGNYHYGFYNPAAMGVMRSSDFEVGGSGYVSYKLGGGNNGDLTYLRFMLKSEDEEDTEVLRVTNFKYWNFQFPYVANGMRLLNLVQYYADLSQYMGQTMYIEAVDNNALNEDLGCLVLDSVITYWEEKPVWYTSESYEVKTETEVEIASPYQVRNGTFETGDLSGWNLVSGETFGSVTSDSNWWNYYSYNKSGRYLFSGLKEIDGVLPESKTGVLRSESFTVGGSGYMTFKLGGGQFNKCYISVCDADTGEELYRFGNTEFNDGAMNAVNHTVFLGNMVKYKADISDLADRDVYIEIVDNASRNWGLLTVDSIITYYAVQPSSGIEAINIKPTLPVVSEYELLNGDFETGDLTGWTSVSGNLYNWDLISSDDTFWEEEIPYNKDGDYFFNGLEMDFSESLKGVIRSSEFTLGGLGIISFKLGGAKDNSLVYLSLKKADGTEIARFSNDNFNDTGFPSTSQGMRLGNMVQYSYQLNASLLGEKLYFEIVDNASQDWGLITLDSIYTYYTELPAFSETCFSAVNLLD